MALAIGDWDLVNSVITRKLAVSTTEIDITKNVNAVLVEINVPFVKEDGTTLQDTLGARVALTDTGTADAGAYVTVQGGTSRTFPCKSATKIHLLRATGTDVEVEVIEYLAP